MILFALIIATLFLMCLKTPTAGVFHKEIVTVLKPFLAIGIVMHHLYLQGEVAYLHEFKRWGPLIVGIFFFISGYGLVYSLNRRQDYLKFFIKDKILGKLLLPWILAWGMYLALNPILWDGDSIIKRLSQDSGPSLFPNDWFVYALTYCYTAYYIGGGDQYLPKSRSSSSLLYYS